MKIITPTSTTQNSHHDSIFAQGADCIAIHGKLSAGLWFTETPSHQTQRIGTIGACEIDDTTQSVQFLTDCADYLHNEQECQTVVGPMNGNTWLRHRLVLESNERVPFLMEPMEPEHYLSTFRAAGFKIFSQYSSSSVDLTGEQPVFESLEKRLLQSGVTIRSIRPENFHADLIAIFKLSLISFCNNFLYTPIDQTSFVGKYQASQEHIDPELVLLAERDGELVGYVFCVPDLVATQRQQEPAIIVKTLAVLPERTLSGLGTVLVAKAQIRAKNKGYQEAIHALQYESNSSLRISKRFSAKVFRRYALMAQSFD